MKRLSLIVLCGACLWFSAGCFRPDVRTVEINVEGVNSADCFEVIEKKIKATLMAPNEAIGPNTRIKSVEWKQAANQILVTFSGRAMAIKNVEYAIADAGFKANDVEPREDPPEGCGPQAVSAP